MKILAIGAHPDDIEIGCGGTLLRLMEEEDAEIHCLVMSAGEKNGDPVVRLQEINEVKKTTGFNYIIQNFPDSNIFISIKLISTIEEAINILKPDMILTHHPQDYHHDHRAISEATVEAGRNEPNILYYESVLTRNFQPLIISDISQYITSKLTMIQRYSSQIDANHLNTDTVRSLAKTRASQSRIGMRYAEAFEPFKYQLL